MKFIKKAIITVLILVLVLAGLGIKTFYDAGEFKEITPHFNGQVKTVAGVLSSEDITIHRLRQRHQHQPRRPNRLCGRNGRAKDSRV
ncbi:MAG: hypothetical protein JRD84_05170 [Deltaproteobacteria bacterium]|nr:hypothetical protein [Deltaproteobacteria bacterium]